MHIPTYRAYHKRLQKMQQVLAIELDPEIGGVEVWGKASVDFLTGEHEAARDFWQWDEIELMEGIGFRDKNGIAVYADDIVEMNFLHPVRGPYTRKARVMYADFRWWLRMLDMVDGRYEAKWLEGHMYNNCVVVGNMWEQGNE